MEGLQVRPSANYSPVISSVIPVSDKTQDVEIISIEADDFSRDVDISGMIPLNNFLLQNV